MKRFTIVVLTLIMVGFFNSFSFYRVAVQTGDVVKLYTTLQTAVDSAASGSDIYVPGTGYSTINLSKKLNFYGTGYYPSETEATGVSYIDQLYLKSGADSSTFCGFSFGTVTSQANQKELVFKRCRFTNINGAYTMTKTTFTESNLSGFSTNLTDCVVQKCFINGQFSNTTQNCLFTNNINISYYIFSTATGNQIENSIFTQPTYFYNPGSGNAYNNNLFVMNPDLGFNSSKNNLFGKALSAIFVNVGNGTAFSYSYDYHLKSDSPGKNHGTDGTDNGIYGTDNPYKDNAVPEIPQITKSIIPSRTANDKLPVEVEVKSQTK
jgi:hypothetical protein